MAIFRYTGRTAQGALTQGQLEAVNAQTVAGQLSSRGIIPLDIQPITVAESINVDQLLGGNKVKAVDLIMFARQMYTITKAGVPLIRGIRGLAATLRHEYFQKVLNEVAGRLEAGASLSSALARHPKVFGNLFVSLVSVGESTGNLDNVFQQLAFYLERDEQTRKSIKSATRYPTFVVAALAVAIAVVNTSVIPQFAELFAKFDAELPLVTRLLIGTSHVFVHYGWLLAAVMAVVGIGWFWFVRTEQGALFWGQYKLRLPVVGDIIERASMARYARSFSLMLRSGVPLNQALILCERAIDNPFLGKKIDQIRRNIERGDSLLRTHMQSEMFSPLVIQMIAVGEESGQVEALMSEVAEFYEREVDYDLRKLSARIEPILIVTMAAFVLVLALGIFLPMWDMYSVQSTGR